ncbi:methyltransferase domain-containing protein [Streptomyces sp. NPDC094048]|uniref:SAM-dependent methyltransferase n=1 Tax=Streptomyces sp. NPDC094048 TaxID=3155207 RepID=UPI00331BBF3A
MRLPARHRGGPAGFGAVASPGRRGGRPALTETANQRPTGNDEGSGSPAACKSPQAYWEPLWTEGRRYRQLDNAETQLLAEHLGPGRGRPALDIGSGEGTLARHLHHSLGHRTTGIDCSPSAIALAAAQDTGPGPCPAWRCMDITADDPGSCPTRRTRSSPAAWSTDGSPTSPPSSTAPAASWPPAGSGSSPKSPAAARTPAPPAPRNHRRPGRDPHRGLVRRPNRRPRCPALLHPPPLTVRSLSFQVPDQ